MNMNGNDFQKGVETLANLSKLAANITTPKPNNAPAKAPQPKGDNTNQPHTQTVEVKLGEYGNQESKKPVILKEKNETHIHKHFPDNRSLTSEECELERFRIEKEYEQKNREHEFSMLKYEDYKREAKEREEKFEKEEARRREERLEREERRRKWEKRMLIAGAVAAGAGMVGYGYFLYTDSRRNRTAPLALQPANPVEIPNVIKGEGNVK